MNCLEPFLLMDEDFTAQSTRELHISQLLTPAVLIRLSHTRAVSGN
jgi:hypothetical protein